MRTWSGSFFIVGNTETFSIDTETAICTCVVLGKMAVRQSRAALWLEAGGVRGWARVPPVTHATVLPGAGSDVPGPLAQPASLEAGVDVHRPHQSSLYVNV